MGPRPGEEELAALADGSLAPDRHAEVQALADGSPELAARLEEQRRAVTLLQGAAAETEAPSGLRARVEAQRRPAARRRYAWAGVAVGAAAAVALVLVLALPSNVPGAPTVAEAAVVGTLPATGPGPAKASDTLLNRSVDGVKFPSWAKKFGWEATGVRVDKVSGRDVTTVFYEKGGHRISYTIVGGKRLDRPEDATITHSGPTELRQFTVGDRRIVTWERGGRTCILSGTDTDFPKLVKLAAWNGKGSVEF